MIHGMYERPRALRREHFGHFGRFGFNQRAGFNSQFGIWGNRRNSEAFKMFLSHHHELPPMYEEESSGHSNKLGSILGLAALGLGIGALGFGIGKAGGLKNFMGKVGNFFSGIFGGNKKLAADPKIMKGATTMAPLTTPELTLPDKLAPLKLDSNSNLDVTMNDQPKVDPNADLLG